MIRKSTNRRWIKLLADPKCLLLMIYLLSCSSCAYSQDHLINEKWLNEVKAAAQATVILNNQNGSVPITSLEHLKIASINLGFNHSAVFDSLLIKYERVDHFNGNMYAATGSLNGLLDDIKYYNTLILEVSDGSVFDQSVLNFIIEVEKKKRVIIALFGDGRSLIKLDPAVSPILWCEKHTPESASFVAQAIFGGVAVNNKLKQTFSEKFQIGAGYSSKQIRLKYTVPEELGINTDDLKEIDSIAQEGIKQHATPGAVVMVIKDGNVIYNKAYGSHTYLNESLVKINDIYDMASVTKISATTMEVMALVETGRLNLDSALRAYIGRTRNTDKQDIKIKELMLHQAGFIPYIPFFQNLKPSDYSRDSSASFPTKVADNYYLRKNYYQEVMWQQMLNAPLISRGKYVYSDLSMYYMQEILEGITNEHLDQYVVHQFYKPLGMQTAGFNPRNRFDRTRIVPTEDDDFFRKTLVHGYVHDQGAAMAGGVAGHAGLFATTNDLAILFQMILNKGTYGGKRYFKPETVELFTANQSIVSRRGLGFDRWDPDVTKHYPSELASPQTFGHTGYTGTCIWVDPQYNLIYMFFSNRIYPKVTERLSILNIRPRIQDAIYKAIKKAGK